MTTVADRMRRRRRLSRRETAVVATYVLAVLGVAGTMNYVVWNHHAQRPPLHVAEAAEGLMEMPVIAGTGAALPLLERLADRYEADSGKRIRIASSIGSSGGLAALADGVIDCAVVSRPLRPEERAAGAIHPFALAPVVLAAGRDVPLDGMASEDLVRLVEGTQTAGSNGAPALMILRETGDSGFAVFGQRITGFHEAWQRSLASGRWPVVYTDEDMERALVKQSAGAGIIDYGTLRLHNLPLHVIPVDGLAPAEDGSAPYPYVRPFTLVCPVAPGHRLAGFVRFLRTPETRQLIRSFGYLEGTP